MSSQERRRQILDAALVEFAEKGFHAANVSAIASRANVSQGAIYWYYKSKKALFLELVAAVFVGLRLPLLAAPALNINPNHRRDSQIHIRSRRIVLAGPQMGEVLVQ